MRIKLNNKFYKKEAIEAAIDSFKDICDSKILDDSFEIEITPKIGTESDISLEFCNFVLGVTKDNMMF